ncbi:MAG: hypothetical protein AB7P03_19815 [Kofleriaceae bacterium]
MRSLLISLSLCLSSTNLIGGCSGDGADTCGADGAPDVGLAAASSDATLTYGNLSALAGNDCPAPDAPAGVVSLSIEGMQTDGTGLITLCIPRPDLLMEGERTLGGTVSMADIRIIDLTGTFNGCTFAFDSTRPPTGHATASGVCANGEDPAGFKLVVDGNVSLRRTCGTTMDSIALPLTGTVKVSKRP